MHAKNADPKKYGSDENFDVIVNDQKGDLEIFRRRTIVEDDRKPVQYLTEANTATQSRSNRITR
ncbi:MAG: NusA N-terminal domain-containing protein [Ferruginibacter sp.]